MARMVQGRWWKSALWDCKSVWKLEGDSGLMMFFHTEDDAWWGCVPGYGDEQTEWLFKVPVDGNDAETIDALQWYLPYWSDQPTSAIKVWPSQEWLHERHLCETDKMNAEFNDLFDNRATQELAVNDLSRVAADSATPGDELGAVDEHYQQCKGGNMNHKIALIVAYERRDWDQMAHLCDRCLG